MDKNDIDVLEKAKCRQIVSEILNFGISQSQILTLIRLLAYELEDRETMLMLHKVISNEVEVEQKPQITI